MRPVQQPAFAPEPPRGLDILDGRRVPEARKGTLLRVLGALWKECPTGDRKILAPLGSFLAENAADVAEAAGQRRTGEPNVPAGSHEKDPVATTLLQYSKRERPSGLTRLTAILVSAAIEAGSDPSARKQVASLASIMRGAYGDDGSALLLLLGEVSSIPALARGVEDALERRGSARSPHPGFEGEWRRWLRDTLIRWIQADPETLRSSLVTGLVIDLDAASVPLAGSDVADPDDAPELEVFHVQTETPTGDRLPAAIAKAIAKARSLLRGSGGDFTVPASQIAPDELVVNLARFAVAAAKDARLRGSRQDAEPPVALALSVAVGLREIDLAKVVWGSVESPHDFVIDRHAPTLHRKVLRPQNSVNPGPDLEDWLATTTDRISLPIPPSVHSLLLWLCPSPGRSDGDAVLPLRSLSLDRRYRLWDIAETLNPSLGLAPSQVRLALASDLRHRFGPEVAQLSLGDTFSASIGSAHYSAPLEFEIATAVAELQQRWFGEVSILPLDRGRSFGSRLVLTDDAAREWSRQLRRRLHKARDEREAWSAHVAWLAASLCAATGVRPEDEIGRIYLDQVIPEYGLIVLRDKAVDTLRLSRIAATGKRWIADLRLFLDRLIRLSDGGLGAAAATLARRILLSEAPLFTFPDAKGGETLFTAADLRRSMPGPLQQVPNFYRHRLTQCLQRAGVDPELRHAQLGWIVSPAHLLADMSHWSARVFGSEMAEVLDTILVKDGWYPESQRRPAWSWDGVPDRPTKDWDAVAKYFAGEHAQNVRKLKEQLRKRWEEVAPSVVSRLAAAVGEFFPSLKLDVARRRLERTAACQTDQAVELSAEHHALLCERARQGDERPADAMEAVAARILLYRIVCRAKSKGIVKGPTPTRPLLGTTSEPSPFLPSIGLAVRHAEAIRFAMLEQAALNRSHDQAPLSVLSVLAYSPYRRIEEARAAVDAAKSIVLGHRRNDCIRLTCNVGGRATHLVLGGLPSMLLGHRGRKYPTSRAPTTAALDGWIGEHLAGVVATPGDSAPDASTVESVLRTAGRLELSGQERRLMLDHAPFAPASVDRCLARDDSWALRTAVPQEIDGAQDTDATYDDTDDAPVPHVSNARSVDSAYHALVTLLSPEGLAKSLGGKSDGHRAWRAKLEKKLAELHAKAGERSNLGLLHGFVRHRLRYGGAREPELAHRTLGSDLTRFSAELLKLASGTSILDWDEMQFRENYLGVLLSKSESNRRQSFDALLNFHDYLVQIHRAPVVSFAELRAIAGERGKYFNPGLLTTAEIARVADQLLADLLAEQEKQDAAPELVRCLEVRFLLFLVLEASSVRPGSAYGLTLGDVFLLGPGKDVVRIRTTGEYGHAKTQRSTGYIPLEGDLWNVHRAWVLQLLQREQARLYGESWWKMPLFATSAGSRRRFGRGYLIRRIDQLLKWVSSDRKASTYWLRKTRVNARHARVSELPRPMARDVHAILCASGHVGIDTPMASYIGEPAVVVARHVRDGSQTSRAAILAITGLDGQRLDVAWHRNGGAQSSQRLATVFTSLGLGRREPAEERLTDPPPLKSGQSFLPVHVDAYARAMQRYADRPEAILRSGITPRQSDLLDQAGMAMGSWRGKIPWAVPGLRQRSAVMATPRSLNGAGKLLGLMSSAPSEELLLLSDCWIRQARLERFYDRAVILVLDTDEELRAAQNLLHATGLALEIEIASVAPLLQVPPRLDRTKSHAPVLQWVLAMVWLHGQAVASTHPPPRR